MKRAAPLLARLLDPAALAFYEGLALCVRQGMGNRPGDRRFPGRPQPSGIELETFRAYAPGDDLRHLDWNAVGRLDALLVRRYTAEREVLFHLLVDCSASMGVPADDGKLATALELAMAVAYMALTSADAVRIAALGGTGPPRRSPVFRQRTSAPRVAEFLAAATPGGALDFGAALESYALQHPQPGTAVVVSDLMMDPASVERGVHALQARRYDVHLLQVVGRRELEPERDFRQAVLADVEGGDLHPIALTPTTLERYRDLLRAHLDALGRVAERNRTPYAWMPSDMDVGEFVTALGGRGLVRRR